jgi:hypothetical protein
MNKHEYLAVLTALEFLKDENGTVWYSYDDNEAGTPVYLDELIKQIKNKID